MRLFLNSAVLSSYAFSSNFHCIVTSVFDWSFSRSSPTLTSSSTWRVTHPGVVPYRVGRKA